MTSELEEAKERYAEYKRRWQEINEEVARALPRTPEDHKRLRKKMGHAKSLWDMMENYRQKCERLGYDLRPK